MNWLQVTIEAGDIDPEVVADVFSERGALSVTFRDAGDEPLLEPGVGETPLWSRTRITALYPGNTDIGALRAALARALGDDAAARVVTEPLEDRDWTRTWLDGFRPMRFGERLWVCPTTGEVGEAGAVVVRLDPGLAFGTGTHPTTALCLEWLDGRSLDGLTVVDYGCGSGILAVAALKLGARRVWAVDNDPQALTATQDNARRNAVEARLHVVSPDDLPADLRVDAVVANILANPLISLAPRLAGLLVPGGRLALSGILADQAGGVRAAYERAGVSFADVRQRQEWVLLAGIGSE